MEGRKMSSKKLMSSECTTLQTIMRMLHRKIEKGYRRACQFVCFPMADVLLCKTATLWQAQSHQSAEERSTQVAICSPPSTILIVNISNSTLMDCAIGNNMHPSGVVENQPLIQESQHITQEQRCSYCHDHLKAVQTSFPPLSSPVSQSVNIYSSNLNYVIIGDNNSMHIEETDV